MAIDHLISSVASAAAMAFTKAVDERVMLSIGGLKEIGSALSTMIKGQGDNVVSNNAPSANPSRDSGISIS